MWSESGNGIDVGPLEAWHEKGESPKSMLAQSKSCACKEFLVCVSKGGYIRGRRC